jgi:hypothetical protein
MTEHDDCLRPLASDEIGRLAVVAGNTATVVPVNYPRTGTWKASPTDYSMQDEYLASPTGRAPTAACRERKAERRPWRARPPRTLLWHDDPSRVGLPLAMGLAATARAG